MAFKNSVVNLRAVSVPQRHVRVPVFLRQKYKSAAPKAGFDIFKDILCDRASSESRNSMVSDSSDSSVHWNSISSADSCCRLSCSSDEEDESAFDTSLEDSDDEGYVNDNKTLYLKACRHCNVTPSQAFARQLHTSKADVSYSMLAAPDIKAMCITLTKNYTIGRIDLSGNDLGLTSVDYLTQSLVENSFITELCLASTKLGTDGVNLLMTSLIDNQNISSLDISDNQISGKHGMIIGETLEKNSTLRHLYLGYCGVDETGIESISHALGVNNTLKTLDLQWNHLRAKGAISICRALKDNDSLETLNLAWNGLGMDGCEELMTSLPKNHSLCDLDLSCNRIDLTCLKKLMTGVENNKSLNTLKLGKNPYTTEGAIKILMSIKDAGSCKISLLDIKGIPVDTSFSKVLEEVKESRDITVLHSEILQNIPISTLEKKSPLDDYDLILVLFEYMRQSNFRLIDFFRSLDTDHSNTISKKEFRMAFEALGIPVTEGGLESVMDRLDMDENREVDIDELRTSQKKNMRTLHAAGKWSKKKLGEDKMADKLRDLVREALEGKHRKERKQSINPFKP